MILKTHHVIMDGIATLVITGSLNSNGYTPDMFTRIVPKLTWVQQIQLYLVLPYAMFIALKAQFGNKL